MNASVPFHAGILVEDIGRVRRHFEEHLGYEFNDPVTLDLGGMDDRVSGRVAPVSIQVTYSRTGPFRLELIETTGDGIYAPALAGLHHLGVWEADMEGTIEKVERNGGTVDAVIRRPDSSISVVYAGDPRSGTRIEYVNSDRREALERWFDTGRYE